ncbi:MAG: serine hydrolase domain-containing protein [Bryobacteraceae bacterium]
MVRSLFMKLFPALLAAACHAAVRITAIDPIFAHYGPTTPGCAAGVAQDGKTLIAKGYGLADLDHRLLLTPHSRFYMASVSKHFTAMAALMAEREGKLSLDDPLSKHIPEMPAYAAGIPLRRLLDHTAGLRDYLLLWGLKGWTNESLLTEGPTLSLIARQKALDFEPGSEYSYSNTGYFLMAQVIQRATGQRLDAFLRDRAFSPLGMRATRFQHDHSEPVPDRAQGYSQHRAGQWRTASIGFDIAGSGGLYSNIEDMLVWARNFEAPKIGGPLFEALMRPGKLNDGRALPRGYALGLEHEVVDGLTRISHSGGAIGYRTFFLRVPERKLSVVVLCNDGGADPRALALRVAGKFVPEIKPEATANEQPKPLAPLSAQQRAAIAGVYWSEELESVWRIFERGGRLYRQNDGGDAEVLKTSDGNFTAAGATIVPREGGFTVSAGRSRGIGFVRR